jgi:type IV secretory pathway TrbD component
MTEKPWKDWEDEELVNQVYKNYGEASVEMMRASVEMMRRLKRSNNILSKASITLAVVNTVLAAVVIMVVVLHWKY